MKCTQIIMAALFAGVLLGGCKKDEPSPSGQPSMGPASPVEIAPSKEPKKVAELDKGSGDTLIPEVSAQLEVPQTEKSEPETSVPPAVEPSAPLMQQSTYGVYLNGTKMGWMELNLKESDGKVVYSTQLEATIRGMGAVSDIKLIESRTYDVKTEALQAIEFEQAAATGSVKISGRRAGDALAWTTSAGGATQTTTLTTADTLRSIKTLRNELKDSKVGDSWNLKVLDASMARDLEVSHTVTKIETRNFAGVESRVFHVESKYLNAGVEETSLFDEDGELLESKVGGFFKALREPPEIAKRKDFQQDLLVSSSVKTPQVIESQSEKTEVSFLINGFGDRLPPTTARQKVETAENGRVRVTLTRDPSLPKHPFPLDAKFTKGAPEDTLKATPYLQSDAPELVEIARRVVAPAKDVAGAVQRLNEFVYQHVRDAYVPAFSNALEALKTGRGDCTEHSALFVAMARAVGLPARVAVGVGYWRPGDGLGWHAWAEVYVDGRWYATDPTWGQTIADATHLQLAGGDLMEQAQIIMLLGNLSIDSMTVR
ncbi:MAG: transglutaminase-like domain-containing protein [Myxococcota bacterium]|nr:transglutaminase-like domain-containing protein [Myxococcota bacterium]